jgi:hypothetical protein
MNNNDKTKLLKEKISNLVSSQNYDISEYFKLTNEYSITLIQNHPNLDEMVVNKMKEHLNNITQVYKEVGSKKFPIEKILKYKQLFDVVSLVPQAGGDEIQSSICMDILNHGSYDYSDLYFTTGYDTKKKQFNFAEFQWL